jgi:arsenate reductase (thioredoxin)
MKPRVLILCTGNSCRSQMAEGILKSFDTSVEVYSAGIEPAEKVHPKANQVMKEVGIDLFKNFPKMADQFLSDSFDCVITICDHAKETYSFFTGKVANRLHIGFDDPTEATGTEEEVLAVFRLVRDEIKIQFQNFYTDDLSGK